jgi:transposase-like protein
MSEPAREPHYFDCPSCKAFEALRLVGKSRRSKTNEYECGDCHSRFGEDELEREHAKRHAED